MKSYQRNTLIKKKLETCEATSHTSIQRYHLLAKGREKSN